MAILHVVKSTTIIASCNISNQDITVKFNLGADFEKKLKTLDYAKNVVL